MKPLSLRSIRGVGVVIAGVALNGCSPAVSFDSADSAARLRAIQRAGAEQDRHSIPKLIEMLDSDDAAVRLTAIGVLEEMTGERMGYDPIAPSYVRADAVEKWKAWYVNGGREAGPGADGGQQGGAEAERDANAGESEGVRGVVTDAGPSAYRNKEWEGSVAGGRLWWGGAFA